MYISAVTVRRWKLILSRNSAPVIIRNNRLQSGCIFWQPADFWANSDGVNQPGAEWGRHWLCTRQNTDTPLVNPLIQHFFGNLSAVVGLEQLRLGATGRKVLSASGQRQSVSSVKRDFFIGTTSAQGSIYHAGILVLTGAGFRDSVSVMASMHQWFHNGSLYRQISLWAQESVSSGQ